MTYGHYRRATPRIQILRGFAGNEPQSITHVAKPKADEAIKSGMLIVLDDNGEWVKCDSASHGGDIPYFAYTDQDATDVQSSGLLLGISCLGEFVIQTPFFDGADTWNPGDPVGKGTSALVGSVDKAASFLAAVETVGIVAPEGEVNIVNVNSEATPVDGAVNVLTIITRWKPATA